MFTELFNLLCGCCMQAMAADDSLSLLALPHPCLLAVQCCVDDTRSVLRAAAAHSRLRRAAVEALSSISASDLQQQHIDSLLLYLAKHGQHVRRLALHGRRYDAVQLRELPPSLTKLDSLQLAGMTLQLQPVLGGAQGVLTAGFPLTLLELSRCTVLEGEQALAYALMQLPDLEQLKVTAAHAAYPTFLTDALPHLQKLTCLLLKDVLCHNRSNSSDPSAALQPLQALTRLPDLQLVQSCFGPHVGQSCFVTADMLSGANQLTCLVLSGAQLFAPRALAGKTQLQHLTLTGCRFEPAAGVAELLSELQHLTQLTHLDLTNSCRQRGDPIGPGPPPAAYASLTASSRLQYLDVSRNRLPSAAWQYMCPPGRTLPQLRHLDISHFSEAVPDTSALVSCCPSLQSLWSSMPCSTAQLAPLQQLTGLHTLIAGDGYYDDLEGVQALCQLTGLQDLDLRWARAAEARILQLTHLTRLTALEFLQYTIYQDDAEFYELRCDPQVSWG
jgi:hypothetical protein